MKTNEQQTNKRITIAIVDEIEINGLKKSPENQAKIIEILQSIEENVL